MSRRIKVARIVTEKIIGALEHGVMPWTRPWLQPAHENPATGTVYRGINQLLLELEAQVMGYVSASWFTWNQLKKRGWSVRRGAKSALVVFWQRIAIVDRDGEEDDEERTEGDERERDGSARIVREVPMLRYYRVFNVDCIEGDGVEQHRVADESREPEDAEKARIFERVEAFIEGLRAHAGLVVEHARKASYHKVRDLVFVPPKGMFVETIRGGSALENYYATLLHEIVHWSGARGRLDRPGFEAAFGTPEYAFEELVAEIGASFLCAQFGLPYRGQHADYVASWLQALEGDARLVIRASKSAQEATEWLLAAGGPAHAAQQAA